MPLTKYNNIFSSKLNISSNSYKAYRSLTKTKSSEILVSEVDVKSLVILLLDSEDKAILEQTLVHLNKIHNEEDIQALNNEHVVSRLLDILDRTEHEECLIKLALKLMTILVKTESGMQVFCENLCYLKVFAEILSTAVDSILLEFCSYILAHLTTNTDHCNYLICHRDIVNTLGDHVLHSSDIDIQYNCVKILENMIVNGVIGSQDDIPVLKIFNLFLDSGIERLQASCLNILYMLTELPDPDNKYAKEGLNQLRGFNNAFHIVENWEYENQKIILLHLIETLPFQYMDITALKKLLAVMSTYEESVGIIIACLNILVKLCSSDHCQDYVKVLDIEHVIINYFLSVQFPVSIAACEGVRILCERYEDYLKEVASNRTVIDRIFELITNEEVDVKCKSRFGKLLLLLMGNVQCCNYIMGKNGETSKTSMSDTLKINILLDIALNCKDDDLFAVMLNCIYKLSSKYECIGIKQLDTILNYFEDLTPQNIKKTETLMDILARCLVSPTFLKTCIDQQGLQIIDDYMRYQSNNSLLMAYGNLLINACKYSDLVHIINELKVFQWLNKQNIYEQPLWNRTIASLLHINLPLKFAFCNALDFINIITDGFYVFRDLKHVNLFDFPSLDKIFRENDKDKVVYVFTRDQTLSYNDIYLEKYISDITILLRDANQIRLKRTSQLSLISNMDESNTIENQIKQNIKHDMEIIATYVVNQMNGHGDVIDQDAYDNHIEEIITDQNSSVIPIGHVKMGLQFERSLLFKCLCDVFGYPCTLVRDEYTHRCYNQVCVEFHGYTSDENNQLDTPWRKHRIEYYEVDLMSNPARLILLNSQLEVECY